MRTPPVDGVLLCLDWAKVDNRVSDAFLIQVLRSHKLNQGLLRMIEATMFGFTLFLAAPECCQPSFVWQQCVGKGFPCAALLFMLAIDPVA